MLVGHGAKALARAERASNDMGLRPACSAAGRHAVVAPSRGLRVDLTPHPQLNWMSHCHVRHEESCSYGCFTRSSVQLKLEQL